MTLSRLSPLFLILCLLFSACAENPLSPSFEALEPTMMSPQTETTLNARVTTLESQVATLQTKVANLEGTNHDPYDPPDNDDPYTPAIPPITSGPVDINNASLEELQRLNGIGPVKAQLILNFITLNGPITDTDDLINVKGIGVKTLAKIEVDIEINPEDSIIADSNE